MRWEPRSFDDGSGGWIQSDTPVGKWTIEEMEFGNGGFLSIWHPAWGSCDEVRLGIFKTEGAAKGACKRFAKKMAAAFKAMGRAGWQ